MNYPEEENITASEEQTSVEDKEFADVDTLILGRSHKADTSFLT